MLRQYIVFQRNIYVFVPTGCSRDLSVRWPLSVQPVAAQCWRSLGRKILSILSKTHFFPEHPVYKHKGAFCSDQASEALVQL